MPSRPGTTDVVIRPATPTDIDFTARTHREHLPHGLFPLLGQTFMKRWHTSFLGAPGGIALVAVHVGDDGERRLGFLVGAVDQVAHVHHVVDHHRFALGAAGLFSLLVRPRLALHFLRTRARAYVRRLTSRRARSPQRSDSRQGGPQSPRDVRNPDPVAVVTALVIVPQARGAGVGAALLAEFVARARTGPAPQAHLTTLDGAKGAGSFYEGLGWHRKDLHVTRDGALMATYCLHLSESSAPALVPSPSMDRTPQDGAFPA